MLKLLISFLLLAIFMLEGCVASLPPVKLYAPPKGVTALPMAQVVGSQTKRSWPIDAEVVWVGGVDGMPTYSEKVLAGRDKYSEPIYLVPGTHTLWIVFSQGKLFGSTQVTIDIRFGQSVIAKGEAHASYLETLRGEDFVVLWIEDASTGQHLNIPTRVGLKH